MQQNLKDFIMDCLGYRRAEEFARDGKDREKTVLAHFEGTLAETSKRGWPYFGKPLELGSTPSFVEEADGNEFSHRLKNRELFADMSPDRVREYLTPLVLEYFPDARFVDNLYRGHACWSRTYLGKGLAMDVRGNVSWHTTKNLSLCLPNDAEFLETLGQISENYFRRRRRIEQAAKRSKKPRFVPWWRTGTTESEE